MNGSGAAPVIWKSLIEHQPVPIRSFVLALLLLISATPLGCRTSLGRKQASGSGNSGSSAGTTDLDRSGCGRRRRTRGGVRILDGGACGSHGRRADRNGLPRTGRSTNTRHRTGTAGPLADRHHLVPRCDSLSSRVWSPFLGRAALGFAGCANSQRERRPAGLVRAKMATPDTPSY